MYLQIFSIFLILVSMIFIICSLLISKKNSFNKEKNSQFECGMNSMDSGRVSFSNHFFSITIMFLIFDVELALILPMCSSINNNYSMSWLMISMMFMSILILGTILEWLNKAMEWT